MALPSSVSPKSRPALSIPRRLARSAVLALVLHAGCSYMSEVKARDERFTVESLRSGRLAVFSVVQVDEIPDVRPPLTDALERVLRATRPEVELVPAERVARALDDSTKRFLLLGYQMHGRADPLWLKRAAASVRGLARYGILARVEKVALRHSDRVDPDPDPEQRSRSGTLRITGQDARVSVHIYDLETLALVFQGAYWGSHESALGDYQEPEARLRPTEDDLDVSTPYDSTIAGVYLKPADLARSLEPAFREFSRSLPERTSASGQEAR